MAFRAYENLLVEVDEGIVVVTINRPRVLNALSRATLDELAEVVDVVGSSARAPGGLDPEKGEALRAVIVTGAGEKAFVAGADISELAGCDPQTGYVYARRGTELFRRLELLPIPVIAAIDGYALGGGMELAMACHVRLATPESRLGQPEVKLGLIPGYGGTQRLPRLVGKGRALELLLTGKMIPADEAYRIGLVNAVVARGELMDAARRWAHDMMAQGPLAVAACLEAVDRGLDLDLDEGLRTEVDLFGRLCASADMKEGTRAFLDKRRARFRGA